MDKAHALTGTLLTLAFFCLASDLLGSSGESEMIYLGDGKYLATRPLWANAYAPNTPENNVGGVNDLNPGDVFSIGELSEATTVLINGFPANVETYRANLQKGDRVLLRNERRWVQLLNLHTSNFFDEGVIEKVAEDGKAITIKFYTNLPSGRVSFESRDFKVTPRMVFRLEGEDTTSEDALKPGRHVRIYRPRPQVVLASNDAGRQDTRGVRGGTQGWTRQGFFRAVSEHATFFAEYRGGRWIDSFAHGKIADIDGYNLGPGAAAAYARPGDRLITGSRIVGDTSGFNTTYGTYIPGDDGSAIGEIAKLDRSKIALKVAKCPSGLAKDGRFESAMVEIASDAEFHLNGKRGSTRGETLTLGNHVRVLAALPEGAMIVRKNDAELMTAERPAIHPIFPTGRSTQLTFLHQTWRQADEVKVLENETARLKVFLYTHGPTKFEWRRNGTPIPGSQGTVDGYEILRFDEYADLTDDGARFTCVAETGAGEVESQPITLRVSADRRPLGLAGAYVAGQNAILLTFNKKVDPRSAQNPDNYSSGVAIRQATLTGDGQTVVLETADLKPGADYNVAVENVVDISAEPNRIETGATLGVGYRVAFRFFRFTLTEKGGLNARLNELRLLVGDEAFGRDVKAYGTVEKADNLFDDQKHTYGHFALDEQVTFDLGAGTAIAPDAIEFEVTTSSRYVLGYLLEGSNDGNTWTKLKEYSGEKLTEMVKHPIDLAALDAEAILRAKRVQTIEFSAPEVTGSPIELTATASSGLPVSYAVIEGPAKVEGNRLTPTGTGRVRLRAMQAGSGEYFSAMPVEQILNVK